MEKNRVLNHSLNHLAYLMSREPKLLLWNTTKTTNQPHQKYHQTQNTYQCAQHATNSLSYLVQWNWTHKTHYLLQGKISKSTKPTCVCYLQEQWPCQMPVDAVWEMNVQWSNDSVTRQTNWLLVFCRHIRVDDLHKNKHADKLTNVDSIYTNTDLSQNINSLNVTSQISTKFSSISNEKALSRVYTSAKANNCLKLA